MSTPNERLKSPASPDQVGKMFCTPYRLRIGVWAVGRALGEPFTAIEAAEALADKQLRNPAATVSRVMPPFVESGMVSVYNPRGLHQSKKWARLDSSLWDIFVAAGEALDIEQSSQTHRQGFTILEASELLAITGQAVQKRGYSVISDSRPMLLARDEIVADHIQTIQNKESELADLRQAGADFGIEIS